MTDQERYHRARHDPGLVVIEGFHALKHAVRFGADLLDVAVADWPALTTLARDLAPDLLLRLASLPVRELGPARVSELSPAPHPTGVIALAARPAPDIERIVCDVGTAPIILLDDPRHSGNIGACVRVAAAADAAALLVTGDADPWNPAAVRGGAGLQFALPVQRIDGFPETKRLVIGVDPDGLSIGDVPRDAILVFGSERAGISSEMRSRIDRFVAIPMRAGVSSLNLATAVAVMLYHGSSATQ